MNLRPMVSIAACAVATVVALGCSNSAAPQASVRFAMDAPFCSSIFRLNYMIDGQVIAIDTLSVNAGMKYPSLSRAFSTAAGTHTLSATLDWGYAFPSRMITLSAGQTVTDSLPFYCS